MCRPFRSRMFYLLYSNCSIVWTQREEKEQTAFEIQWNSMMELKKNHWMHAQKTTKCKRWWWKFLLFGEETLVGYRTIEFSEKCNLWIDLCITRKWKRRHEHSSTTTYNTDKRNCMYVVTACNHIEITQCVPRLACTLQSP